MNYKTNKVINQVNEILFSRIVLFFINSPETILPIHPHENTLENHPHKAKVLNNRASIINQSVTVKKIDKKLSRLIMLALKKEAEVDKNSRIKPAANNSPIL